MFMCLRESRRLNSLWRGVGTVNFFCISCLAGKGKHTTLYEFGEKKFHFVKVCEKTFGIWRNL